MATKKKTDIEKAAPAELATVDPFDELSAFFDDPEMVDGLEDFENEDIKISSILWNMRAKGKDGRALTKDVFFDTITEDTCETLDLVMLTSKKTLKWDEFDNALDKTVTHCSSSDRVTGTLASGERRPCADCPDTGWFQDEKGKAFRRCGPVHNVVALTYPAERLVMIKFKKTGLKPFQQYTSTHHKNARPVEINGRKVRRNVPLFAYATRLSLRMSDNGMYATPAIEPIKQSEGPDGEPSYLLPTADILSYGALAKEWTARADEAIATTDQQADAYQSADDDSSSKFDANAFADD